MFMAFHWIDIHLDLVYRRGETTTGTKGVRISKRKIRGKNGPWKETKGKGKANKGKQKENKVRPHSREGWVCLWI
jgi:hypothetical protein